MAWGRRCDLGCESWPDSKEFEDCPLCGQHTTRFSNLTILEVDEARSIKARADFDAYYEVHCSKGGYGTEGPLPEETPDNLVPLATSMPDC